MLKTKLKFCFAFEILIMFVSSVRASTAAVLKYVTLRIYISHPSLVIYVLFCNPTHKTETGTAGDY